MRKKAKDALWYFFVFTLYVVVVLFLFEDQLKIALTVIVLSALVIAVAVFASAVERQASLKFTGSIAKNETVFYQQSKPIIVVQQISNKRFSEAVFDEFRLREIILDEILEKEGDRERAKALFFAAHAAGFRPYRIGEIFQRRSLPLDEEWIELCQREMDEMESGKKEI